MSTPKENYVTVLNTLVRENDDLRARLALDQPEPGFDLSNLGVPPFQSIEIRLEIILGHHRQLLLDH